MNTTREPWQGLLNGSLSAAEAAQRLGVSEAQAQLFADFHQASRAQLALEQQQRRQAARRTLARAAVAVLAAGLVGSGVAVAASGACPNGYPFCFAPDQPARASEVNHNFSQIKEWLETKVGSTSTPNVTIAGTLSANGASVTVPTGSVTVSAGNVNVPTGALSFGATRRQMLNLWDTSFGFGIQDSTLYARSATNFAWHTGGTHNNNALNPGGGTLAMSLRGSDLTVTGRVTASDVLLPNLGDTAITSSGDSSPEVYQLTGPITGRPCDAAHRGSIFVAQPTAQTNQDSLCYCGSIDGTYETWCFNP